MFQTVMGIAYAEMGLKLTHMPSAEAQICSATERLNHQSEGLLLYTTGMI